MKECCNSDSFKVFYENIVQTIIIQRDGWLQYFELIPYQNGFVIQLTDYFGGEGEKPTEYIGWYMGADGWVQNIADAYIIGKNGDTPEIGLNGNWWIAGVDTGLPSRGIPGFNKIADWTPEPVLQGEQRIHNGQMWEAVVNTTAAQEPGVVAETVWKRVIDIEKQLSNDTRPVFTDGGYYATNGSSVPTSIVSTSISSYAVVSVMPKEVWYIKGKGVATAGRLWAWARSDRSIISAAPSTADTGEEYISLVAPEESALLFINTETSAPHDAYMDSIVGLILNNSQDVSDLKFKQLVEKGFSHENSSHSKAYGLSGVSVTALVDSPPYEAISVDVQKGDVILIKGAGGTAPRLWAVTDANGLILKRSEAQLDTKNKYITVEIENELAAKLYANNEMSNEFSVLKFSNIIKTVSGLGSKNSGEIFIAASDSSELDKTAADYICTGVNDERVIQSAVDLLVKGGTVWLFSGSYWIDEFPIRSVDTPPTAIYFGGSTHRFIELKGYVKNQIAPGRGGAMIRVSEAAYNALDTTTQVAIIGGSPEKNGYFHYNSLVVSDVIIRTPRNEKPTISLDFRNITTGGTSGAFIFADTTHANIYTGTGRAPIPNRESVGIYGFKGSNSSYYTGFWHTIVHGYGEGFKMGGDHVLMVKCATSRCTYGYTFGTFIGGLHPMTLINCVDETNTNYPFFGQYANMQPITAIDWNMETLANRTPEPFNKHAQEEVPGTFYGEWNWSSMGDIRGEDRFWENDGSGKNFKTWNHHHAQFGTTSVRNAYAASLAQRYYDIDLKLDLIYDGNRWVRSDGSKDTALKIGTTSQRPILADAYAGYQFFDNTLNKLIILKSSGVWVDVNGSPV